MPIGPHIPFPSEILHNRTQDQPGQPPPPYQFWGSQKFFDNTDFSPKEHHDRRHNTKDLPELHPGQQVLFLSPTDANSYIEGTITGPATTPHSYMLQALGRTYCHNRHHIHPIHTDTIPFSRPSMHFSQRNFT